MNPFFRYLIFILLSVTTITVNAQEEEIDYKDINELLEAYNKKTVPYITVDSLEQHLNDFVILDTRKKKEYEVSHLPNAIWVGERLRSKRLDSIALKSDAKIVVYCSVGIRSENYGEQLLKKGYTQVFNLYGSIFSWKDAGYALEDENNQPTDEVHVFSERWAKYLQTGNKVH